MRHFTVALNDRILPMDLFSGLVSFTLLTPPGESGSRPGVKHDWLKAHAYSTIATIWNAHCRRAKATSRGLVKISATSGFGRRHIAAVLSEFARSYQDVKVQLHSADLASNLVEQGFDSSIRFGELPDTRLTARKLADKRQLPCAAPSYLCRAGNQQERILSNSLVKPHFYTAA